MQFGRCAGECHNLTGLVKMKLYNLKICEYSHVIILESVVGIRERDCNLTFMRSDKTLGRGKNKAD